MSNTDQPAGPPEATSGVLTKRQVNLIMVGLLAGLFLAALDQTIVGTALKRIAGDFNAFDEIPWVVTSYMLFATASTPLYGKISDIIGRRPVYIFSILVFLGGSILAGLSQDMTQLIITRGIQGLGAGGLMPLAFAIISDIVSLKDRAKYQGWFGAVFGLSSVIGPLLGGLFTDTLSWRWCFYINLPVGAVALYAVAKYFHFPHTKRQVKIDYIGATMLVAAVSLLLLALEFGNSDGWASAHIIGYFAAAVVLAAVFIWWEGRVAEPILPLKMFRNRTITISTAIGFIMMAGMIGAIIYVPQYLQIEKGYTATEAGLATIPMVVGILSMSIGSGRAISRTGRYRIFPIVGSALLVVAMFLMSTLAADSPVWELGVFLFVLGCGIGLCMQTLIIAAQSAAEPRDLGVVTSTATFFRSMGGTIGVAVFGVLLNGRFVESVTPAYDAAKPTIDAAAAAPGVPEQAKEFLGALNPDTLQQSLADSTVIDRLGQLSPPLQQGTLDAFINSLQYVYAWAIPLMGLAFLLSLLLKEIPLRQESGLDSMRAEAKDSV